MYRIGLIGNRAHQNSYGPIWHEREDCKIVAAAEHHEGKGEALSQLYGLEVARDYDAVLEDPNVDIVSICTDFYLKRTLIKKALACGKHVLVDKAIARNRCRSQRNCRYCRWRIKQSTANLSLAVFTRDDKTQGSP